MQEASSDDQRGNHDLEKGQVNSLEAPLLNDVGRQNDDDPVSADSQVDLDEKSWLLRKFVPFVLVIAIVMVEAYFVGYSFRKWLEEQTKTGNSTSSVMSQMAVNPSSIPVSFPVISVENHSKISADTEVSLKGGEYGDPILKSSATSAASIGPGREQLLTSIDGVAYVTDRGKEDGFVATDSLDHFSYAVELPTD